MLKFTQEQHKRFEISVVIRDPDGNPLSRREFSSNSAYKIWEFYERNRGVSRKKKAGKVATAKQADKVLKEMYESKDKKEQEGQEKKTT